MQQGGFTPTDERLMGLAIDRARAAAEHGDVPIGALLARDGALLAAAIPPPTPRSWRSAPRRSNWAAGGCRRRPST
jgi:hypothetical protein